MKTHFALVRENQWGGHTYRTLCGRSHSQSEGGMNSTGNPAEVTCKFCLRDMKAMEQAKAYQASRSA